MTADITPFAEDQTLLPILDPLRLQWAIDQSHLEANLNIFDGETLVGECQSWGIPPEFAACPAYDQWMQIEWLGVEEVYRRRGVARRLMHEQFRYHAARRFKRCLLYTELDNPAAQSLYKSLGFTTEAEVWGWMW